MIYDVGPILAKCFKVRVIINEDIPPIDSVLDFTYGENRRGIG